MVGKRAVIGQGGDFILQPFVQFAEAIQDCLALLGQPGFFHPGQTAKSDIFLLHQTGQIAQLIMDGAVFPVQLFYFFPFVLADFLTVGSLFGQGIAEITQLGQILIASGSVDDPQGKIAQIGPGCFRH